MGRLTRRALLAGAGVGLAATLLPRPAFAQPWPCDAVIIGDSLTAGCRAGMADALAARGLNRCVIDGVKGRHTTLPNLLVVGGAPLIRYMRQLGVTAPAWVVALGTNDLWLMRDRDLDAYAHIRAVLRLLPDATVVWPTLIYRVPEWQGWADRWNAALRDLTAEWPGLRVVEWEREARDHPEWFDDKVHHTAAGWVARQAMLVDAACSTYRPVSLGAERPSS